MMVRKQSLFALFALASFVVVGCKNSLLDRSLIFSTHTTLGVEASVSPAESGEPGKLIIGYKRTEGVINPVYHSAGIKTGNIETVEDANRASTTVTTPCGTPRYRGQAYSVIAKFRGEAGGKANEAAEGKLSVAQWFATGEAAKTLAGQPGIAGAVTGSSEIEKAISARRLAGRLTGDASLRAQIVIVQIYEGLEALADEGDKEAEAHIQALDELGNLAPEEFTSYDVNDGGVLMPMSVSEADLLDDGRVTFKTYTAYRAALRASINVLSRVLARKTFQYQPSPDASPAPAAAEQKSKLEEILMLHKTLQRNLAMQVAQNQATVAAINYYCEVLTQ